jgi:hypothetical protein
VALARSDKPDVSGAIALAIEVAGVRVIHPGPRAWLAALQARPQR